ncbi:MAG: TolC family protein [Saprospiraceae bacterium]|nr:TolC family protein [Saprospiraceae bacterium]
MRIIYFSLFLILFHTTGWGQRVLTLDDAIKNALENNYNIRIARNETVINQANNTRGNAGMNPEVALNFGQNFNINNTRQEFFSGDVREGNGVNTNNLNANIQANWTVFDGMRMFVNKNRLDEIENLGKINLQLQMENTISQVMSIYFNMEQQKRRISTIKEALEISKERLALAKLNKDVGSGSGIPILQAEVDINADSSVLINQLLILKNMKVQLNELIASDLDEDFDIAPSADIPLLSYNAVMADAEKRNKLLAMADKNIQLSMLTVKQWETNKYPTIDLNAGYNFSRLNAEIGILKFNQNAGISFGLTGRWNIFTGWNNKRETQIAKLNVETGKLAKEQINLALKSDLLTMFNTYINANAMSLQEDKNIKIAQQNLDITTDKMRIGTINALELRQAQLNLVDANFRKISALFDSKMAALELMRLSGALLPNQ